MKWLWICERSISLLRSSMEWHGALLKMNGTGQRILTVIIWFTLNDNFYQAIKLVQIQRMKRSLDGRVSGQSGPVLSAVHRLLVWIFGKFYLYLYWHMLRNYYVIASENRFYNVTDWILAEILFSYAAIFEFEVILFWKLDPFWYENDPFDEFWEFPLLNRCRFFSMYPWWWSRFGLVTWLCDDGLAMLWGGWFEVWLL